MRKLVIFSVAVFTLCAASTFAGPGKRKDLGTSNNGPGIVFADCISPTQTSNCANFTTAPFETVDGFQIFKFGINDGFGGIGVFDVFQIPVTVTPGSTFSMTLNTLTGDYGAFACNNSEDPLSTTALDSLGNPLVGPCTGSSLDAIGSFLTEGGSGNTASFKFVNGPNFPALWTFYTTDGNLSSLSFTAGDGGTTVPEPSSLFLLGAGALAAAFFAAKSRRSFAINQAV
jgi:hypothetical protein